MKGFHADIEKETLKNKDFRHVIYTGNYMQLVYMTLKPGESIGTERHGSDQFFRFEKGNGEVRVDDNIYKVTDGSAVIVPSGSKHNVTNTSTVSDLFMYTIYAAPNHPDGMKFATKDAAEKNDKPFDGITSEASKTGK